MSKITLTSNAEIKALEACQINNFGQINLKAIKTVLAQMLSMIGRDGMFSEYTKHSILHVDAMLQLLDHIITKRTNECMTDADWLLTVLSFYFHDLGMLVTKQEYNNRQANDEYIEFKTEYLDDCKNEISLNNLATDDKEKFIYQEYVRKNHGRRISDWLNGDNSQLYDKSVLEFITKMIDNLPALFIKDLASICQSHNEEDLYDSKKYPIKRNYGNTPQETANVFFVALLLRTADLLHITSDRTPTVEFQLISPTNPVSQLEWTKQASVNGISVKDKENKDGKIDKNIQSDTFQITGFFKDPKGYFALMDYLAYAQRELQISYKLNEDNKRKFANTYEYEFPWRYIDDSNVETKDFEPRQLSFSIDQQKTLDLLVGETLYNNLTVAIREIAQNAIDAVRVKRYEKMYSGERAFNPKIEVSWDKSTRKLVIADNGTGMDMDIIENHLLRVGSSRYQDEEFRKKHPDYNSISRFGIGLLSCFLVADDVDILTRMNDNEKPLLLKISKLHGRYLLKHGVEDGSNLHLIERTGTSIELKIRPEIDIDPESILKNWILFPVCEFTFHSDGKSISIGYNDTTDYIQSALKKVGIEVDNENYKIQSLNDGDIDFSVLLRKNKYVNEWNFVEYQSVFGNKELDEIPCGIGIEGIRIDENTPGFKTTFFVAMVNLSGKNAPQTNVARSAINSLTIDQAFYAIYTKYLEVINTQVKQLSTTFSITWASVELSYLLSTLFSHRNYRAGEIFVSQKMFNEALCNQAYYLIEKDKSRKLCSIEELDKLGYFWTIESSAYNSANNLIREINTSDFSSIELLKTLYGPDNKMLKNIDILLSTRRYNNFLDKMLLKKFQVSAIHVFKEYRCMTMKWGKINAEKYWQRIPIENSMRNVDSEQSLFLQVSNNIEIDAGSYDGVRSEYGLFLFQNTPIHTYLLSKYTHLCEGNEDNSYIIQELCTYISKCCLMTNFNGIKWEKNIEEHFSKQYTGVFYQEFKEKIDIQELVQVCMQSKFNVYDKNRWYRNSRNLY